MALTRMVLEIGMGTDLGGSDYTKAAIRAVEDALWHNSLTVADAFGVDREEMHIECHIGAGDPDAIDASAIIGTFPYGEVTVIPSHGGMDIPKEDGDNTVVVNAAVVVYLDLPEGAQ